MHNTINAYTAATVAVHAVLKRSKKAHRALETTLRNAQLGSGGRGGTLQPRVLKPKYPDEQGMATRKMNTEKRSGI